LIRGFSRGAKGKCQGGDKRCLPLGSLLKGETFGSTEDTPFLSEEIKRIKIELEECRAAWKPETAVQDEARRRGALKKT